MIVHRLVGLKFNTVYQINIFPVFQRTAPSGMYGEVKSVFCRTLSKRVLKIDLYLLMHLNCVDELLTFSAPRYVPTPEFHSPLGGAPGVVTVYRVNEQNGTVATYELLVREAGTLENSQAVLAQFPAVTLFKPLSRSVRVILNGSSVTNVDRESGLFFAPSLMPGQPYNIAVRACVEVICLDYL